MVDAEDAFGQLGVGTVDGVADVYQVSELDKVVLGGLQVVGLRAVDLGDAALEHPDPDRIPVVVVEPRYTLVLGIPERLPGVVHGCDVGGYHVRSPADAGQVDGVWDGVARPLVVVGVGEHRPDILFQVRQVVVVEGLQQLPCHELRYDLVRRDEHVEVDLAGPQLPGRLLEVVEGSELDLDIELLLEILEYARVDIIRPVVKAQRPFFWLHPGVDHRVVVVKGLLDRVFPGADNHARSRRRGASPRTATGEQSARRGRSRHQPQRLTTRHAPPPGRSLPRVERHLYQPPFRASAQDSPFPTPRPGPPPARVPFSPSLCPSTSKPNSLAAAPRHISLASSPLTAGSSNSTWSARPSMSADRYVAKRSGSQGPNWPERWPSLTTSTIVLRQRRSSASRLRAASSLRKARDHNSTHSVQYSSLSRRTTGGHASSIKRTSRCEASSMPVSSRKASM